ncbi:MAG: gfo/Idh/MocA family oxidoreductase [Chitinivibrionales bacterium]|nr:gfo/Idh/MocA family oxidoreductase [Chitinivibrionales bacterium]
MLRIGIAGLGVMGRNHLRVLQALPDVRVEAVCDPAVDGLEGIRCHRDISAMTDAHRLDAVVVAVPTPQHTGVCLTLAERGISMLIEKPVAATVSEAEKLRAAVRKAGVKAAVGHVERFNPVVQALKRELAGRDIYSLSFTRVGHMPPRIADVGVLTDLAVHDIDLLRYITGRDIVSTTIYKSRTISEHREDSANVSFELRGGILATITTNWLTPFKRRRVEVTTADGYFELDLIAQELFEYSAYTDDDSFLTRPCRVKKGEPLANELSAFVRMLETGESGDLATIEDSIATLAVIEGTAGGSADSHSTARHE